MESILEFKPTILRLARESKEMDILGVVEKLTQKGIDITEQDIIDMESGFKITKIQILEEFAVLYNTKINSFFFDKLPKKTNNIVLCILNKNCQFPKFSLIITI
ncbi:MAG: hypothetical protein EXR20_04925 [Bacteroidetes bacterium]|jgi:hypothetical protein|nr:hypothetical protein [Bacteroidota bacterium]